jgi:hypothetical protein
MTNEKPDTISMDAVDVLKGIRKGRMLHELATKLEELTTAIRETNQKGSLTLKLTITPLKKGDADGMGAVAIALNDVIRIDKPEPARADTLFFAARNGSLSRNNPDKMDMKGQGFPEVE